MIVIAAFVLLAGFSAQASNLQTHFSLYSETLSSQRQAQNALTESRIRFHPYKFGRVQPFLGFYKNPFTYGPTAGVLVDLDAQGQHFHLLAEQRLVYGDHINAVGEGRLGIIAGDWREFNSHIFLETYGESIYIPRLDKTPVSTLWSRLGWRQTLPYHFYLDPFFQVWMRASVSRDLGEAGTELRPGLRVLWYYSDQLALSATGYRRLTVGPMKDNQWEALLVLQGAF